MTIEGLPAQVSPPAFAISDRPVHAIVGVDVIAIPVLGADAPADAAPDSDRAASLTLGPGASDLGDDLGIDLLGAAEALGATGAVGEALAVPVPLGGSLATDLRMVLLVGVGRAEPDDLRRAGATLARAARGRVAVATTVPALDAGPGRTGLTAFVAGAMLGSFDFGWRSSSEAKQPVPRIVLAGWSGAPTGPGETAGAGGPDRADESDQAVLERAVAIGGAGWRARFLATCPSNLKSPERLAEQARRIAEADDRLSCRIWDERDLARDGFGGLLGVGAASATPPRLIRLDYSPRGSRAAGRRRPTVALVGKGITFDSGGLSIKPGEAMKTMKRDMSGGAVVLATMAALDAVGCEVDVVGLVPSAENAISGSAMRPGDVLRHYGGRTTEVTNTDAEGRLVLADALAYAVAEVEPDLIVDVATLTGAVKVALGQQVGGLFATHDALAAGLLEAGRSQGEPLWRLPLHQAYRANLASKVADADNGPSGPGALLAALFLQPFVGETPWAHLDVASVGDSTGDTFEYTPGPTGFGARALLSWLGGDPMAGMRD